MYAEGALQAETPQVLLAPRSAILYPGHSAYAYVDKGDGAYERRQVRLGGQVRLGVHPPTGRERRWKLVGKRIETSAVMHSRPSMAPFLEKAIRSPPMLPE